MVPWPVIPTTAVASLVVLAAAILFYFARGQDGAVAALARTYLLLGVACAAHFAAYVGIYAARTTPGAQAMTRLMIASTPWLLLAIDAITARVSLGRAATHLRAKVAAGVLFSALALATPLAAAPAARPPAFPTYLDTTGLVRIGPLTILAELSMALVVAAALRRCLRRSAPPTARGVGLALLIWVGLGCHDVAVSLGLLPRIYLAPLGVLVLFAVLFRVVLDALAERERQREALRLALLDKTREAEAASAALLSAERLSSLGRIAAGIAHEVNNPAGVILANLTQLRERFGGADEAAAHAFDDSIAGVLRIRDIVAALRTLAQGPEQAPEPVRLDRVVETALLLAQPSVKQGVEIRREVAETPPAMARPGELLHIVLDLLGDAIDAVGIAGTITVATRRDGAAAVLEVRGPRRVDVAARGVRLDVVRNTLASLGGALEVATAREGSAHRVRLPALPLPAVAAPPPAPPPERRPVAAPPSAEALRSRARVLIVDDEPAMLRVLGRVVGRAHEAILAGDADAVLAEVRAHGHELDLVLCDVILADTNGVALRDEVLAVAPRLADRFVFMTGGGLPAFLADGIRATGSPVLEKPIDPDDLLACVRSCLRPDAHPADPPTSGG